MTLLWARIFVERRLAAVGPVLFCVMLVPTFHYWTFYDLATGMFFTLGLYAVLKRKWLLFVVTVALGTFNHEVILLLIPTAGVVWWSSMPRVEWLWRVGVPLGVHAAGRALLFAAIPAEAAWQPGRVAFNLGLPFNNPDALFMAILTLWPWWAICAVAWPKAPMVLRRCTVLLPLQAGVVFLFGQFNEPRLFIPFMPVAIGYVLVWMDHARDGGAPNSPVHLRP